MSPMTTHRSLNKLEYKAHMSIHNVAEVAPAETESHESAFTRDRLGRRHKLFEGDGTSRIFKSIVWACVIWAGLGWSSEALAVPENIRVSSDDLEQKEFDDRLGDPGSPEKFSLFDDGSRSVGFNDNGDPNVAMRF